MLTLVCDYFTCIETLDTMMSMRIAFLLMGFIVSLSHVGNIITGSRDIEFAKSACACHFDGMEKIDACGEKGLQTNRENNEC